MVSTPISPKVTAGANWATYATLLLTLLSSITPDSLDFLGKWAPLAYGVVVGASYAVGAYLKEDPLRTANAQPASVAVDPGVVVAEIANRLAKPADPTN